MSLINIKSKKISRRSVSNTKRDIDGNIIQIYVDNSVTVTYPDGHVLKFKTISEYESYKNFAILYAQIHAQYPLPPF